MKVNTTVHHNDYKNSRGEPLGLQNYLFDNRCQVPHRKPAEIMFRVSCDPLDRECILIQEG